MARYGDRRDNRPTTNLPHQRNRSRQELILSPPVSKLDCSLGHGAHVLKGSLICPRYLYT